MFKAIARKSAASFSSLALAVAVTTGASLPQGIANAAIEAPPRSFATRLKAAPGAPNILLIMTDDVGFGASSTFGGPIPTPTFDRLASQGLKYNQFHTTAMCSPTRAALLTGRNAHSVGFGVISEDVSPAPGYNGSLPKSAATIARVLGMNGYDSAMLGKHHNVPLWEDTPLGPFDRWPNGLGFDYFYGFMAGATNQYAPALIENRNWVERPPDDPDYILDKDLADHAINWLNMQHSVRSDAPFLMYYAPGTAHSPQQAPPDWIAKFSGKFSQGWDKMREETFARQKRLGVVPANARLTPRPAQMPAWNSLSADQKKVAERMMEVHAAALAYCDFQIGRILDSLRESGRLDNTLVMFIQGDNGGSLEGSPAGTMDDIARGKNRMPDTLQDQLDHLQDFGGPHSFNNYPVGWAWAMNTPFQWGKVMASHLGGIRNGMVVSWPAKIKKTGTRSQFHHVIDVAPTLYEVAGVTPPATVDGVEQQPIAGVSIAYSFDDPDAPSRRHEQYFELRGNTGYYKDGWFLSTRPEVMPWNSEGPPAADFKPKWELYDLSRDYSQSRDLASREPVKLAELQAAYRAVAEKYQVIKPEGTPANASRPFVTAGRKQFVYHNSPMRYSRYAFANIMNTSWQSTALIDVPQGAADGTLVAQGGWLVGWGIYVIGGKPQFIYKATGQARDMLRLAASDALPPGRHEIAVKFTYDGGGVGKGGQAGLWVDGREVASGRVARTFGALMPNEGGASIGRDYGTTLTDDYRSPFTYPGKIEKVTIDLLQ
jgi:arylsulfatase A-like enzyme